MRKKKYRDPERELKRQETIRRRKGQNWFHENAVQAGKLTPTKFTSQTASAAAKKRWDKIKGRETQKGEISEQGNPSTNAEGPRYIP